MKIHSDIVQWMLILLVLIAGPCLSSCGSIIHGRTQSVPISTNPAGATVYVDGEISGFTPTSVTLDRKHSHSITIAKEGYENEVVNLYPRLSSAVFGNVTEGAAVGLLTGVGCVMAFSPCSGPMIIGALAGTAIGTAADMMLGGAYCLSRNSVSLPLQPTDIQRPPPFRNDD